MYIAAIKTALLKSMRQRLSTGNLPNNQFKRDSQRLAFLLLLQVKCLWHNALGWVVALLTP
ncbi:hypothetical protein FWP56_21895 [Vibrio vulnificus]|nr:hypothetical protein [Vibrio vulnificus]